MSGARTGSSYLPVVQHILTGCVGLTWLLAMALFGDLDLKAFLEGIEWEDKNQEFDTFALGIFHANGIKASLSGCTVWLRLVRSLCRTYRRSQI